MLRKILVTLSIALLTACASLEAPKTVGERIEYAYASLAAVVNSTANLAERGRISKAQAIEIRKQAKAVQEILIIADFANDSGNPTTAMERLQAAEKILVALEAKLREMENK